MARAAQTQVVRPHSGFIVSLRFESIEFHGEEEVEAAISRNDPSELLYVPVAVSLYAEDFDWAQQVCVDLASHTHFNVRGNAVLGLAHLARRFKRLSRSVVEPILLRALVDPDEYVREQADAAIDDVKHFLGWPSPTVE